MTHKEIRRAGEAVAAAATIPPVMESIAPGSGLAAASVLGPVAGLGVTMAGFGMVLRCI